MKQMVYDEPICLDPFHNVILTCDKCGQVSNGGPRNKYKQPWDHVVEVVVLETGMKGTICKRCFQEMAVAQELVSKP